MSDVVFVAATLVFFVVAILYIYGCQYFIKTDKTTTVTTEQIETNREREQIPA